MVANVRVASSLPKPFSLYVPGTANQQTAILWMDTIGEMVRTPVDQGSYPKGSSILRRTGPSLYLRRLIAIYTPSLLATIIYPKTRPKPLSPITLDIFAKTHTFFLCHFATLLGLASLCTRRTATTPNYPLSRLSPKNYILTHRPPVFLA